MFPLIKSLAESIGFYMFATILMLVMTIPAHAPHSRELDTQDKTIQTGRAFLDKVNSNKDPSSLLWAACMHSLLLEYHLLNNKADYYSNLAKAVLSSEVETISNGGLHFPLRGIRLSLQRRREYMKFPSQFDYTVFDRVEEAYDSTSNAEKKLMVLACIHATICIHKFHPHDKKMQSDIYTLLQLCTKREEASWWRKFITWREKKNERVAFNILDLLIINTTMLTKDPKEKIVLIETARALQFLKRTCMNEVKIITQTETIYQDVEIKINNFSYLIMRAQQKLQASLAHSNEFDEPHALVLSLFVVYQRYLSTEYEKYFKHLTHKGLVFRLAYTGLTTIYFIAYIAKFYTDAKQAIILSIFSSNILSLVLFSCYLLYTIINYLMLIDSFKMRAHEPQE